MSTQNKRIYSGIYRRYDGKEIQVIISAKNIDTGEEMLVCKRRNHGEPKDYFTISIASFCETVETPKGPKPKYTRQTQHRESDAELEYYNDLGFDQTSRLKRRHRRDTTDEYPVVRTLHMSESYPEYARELCEYHLADTRRVRLCMENKMFYGVSQKEYDILLEDLRFTNSCFKTVLKEYSELFYGCYGSKQLSIRKYAEEHQMNRGSVVYLQEKMVKAFAKELKERDNADGITHIRPPMDDEFYLNISNSIYLSLWTSLQNMRIRRYSVRYKIQCPFYTTLQQSL